MLRLWQKLVGKLILFTILLLFTFYLNVLLGHAGEARIIDGFGKLRIGVQDAAPNSTSAHNLTKEFLKDFAPFLILCSLLMLDVMPFAVSCHPTHSGPSKRGAKKRRKRGRLKMEWLMVAEK